MMMMKKSHLKAQFIPQEFQLKSDVHIYPSINQNKLTTQQACKPILNNQTSLNMDQTTRLQSWNNRLLPTKRYTHTQNYSTHYSQCNAFFLSFLRQTPFFLSFHGRLLIYARFILYTCLRIRCSCSFFMRCRFFLFVG